MAGGQQGPPNLQLSPQERLAFAHYFSLADPSNSGLVQGHNAVPFFAKSKLPPAVLGQIWSLADATNNGFLTAPTFSVALRLIGHAQRGEHPDEALIQKSGPPPTLEGVQLPSLPSGAAMPMSPQRTGGADQATIKPEDRARYTRLFASAGPSGGLLDGDKAKDILVKSKLPFDKLGAIWSLADTKARGALDLTDFIIAMHFIQQSMNGTITSVPATLPPGLYESAAGTSAAGFATTPGSPLRSQPLSPSHTGLRQQQPLSPAHTGARSAFGSPQQTGFMPAQNTGLAATPSFLSSPFAAGPAKNASNWAITPDEKAAADKFFDALDTQKHGVLQGQTVVPFFMQSQLNEQALAHVWDLSDVTQSGALDRDEFAVAMHLIKSSLAGNTLPQELPADLVPPSLRNQRLPEPVNPQQTETQKDLFSLMDDDDAGSMPPPSLPASAASAFGAPAPGAPVSANAQQQPQSSSQSRSVSAASPFDDDFFGGGGSAGPAAAAAAAAASPAPAPAPRGQMSSDQSAEYGNKSLQLNSTQKAVDELQSKRSTLESGVSQNATSLAELETRLASVKSTHETESRLVKDLEARRDKQSVELKTLRDQLISEESELSRLKAEKDEIEQQVLHDREEVRDAKKRMGVVQTELAALKSQLEKLRKDARQQRGLLAIGKKQLSTAEADKDKVQSEIDGGVHATDDVDDVDGGGQHTGTREAEAVMPGGTESVLSPGAPASAVLSPAASVKSNNPFDRFQSAPGGAESSGHRGAGAIAAGAAGGVAAATAGVAALHHHHDDGSDDPFGQQQPETRESNAGADADADADAAEPATDPWGAPAPGAPTSSGAAPAAAPAHAAFDDAFGDDFAPSDAPARGGTTSTNDDAAFDDAFGGFDEPQRQSAGGTEAALGSAPLPINPGTTEESSADRQTEAEHGQAAAEDSDVFASNVDNGDDISRVDDDESTAPAPAPTADEVATDADVLPVQEQAPAVANVVQPTQRDDGDDGDDDDDDDSSDDDEEDGPEDVEGFRRRTAAAADDEGAGAGAGALRSASPDEAGRGKEPTSVGAGALGIGGTGVAAAAAASGLPSATTAAQASDRFPELPTDDNDVDADADVNVANKPIQDLRETPANAGGSSDSVLLDSAQMSRATSTTPGGTTGGNGNDSDAFVDALSGSNDNDVGAGAGGLDADAISSVPAAADATSPPSSIKTRRAPPPAPVRSSGAGAGAGAGAAMPSTPATPVVAPPQQQQQQTSFDDFEASFADLGAGAGAGAPAGQGSTTTAPTTTALGAGGFDDAFDDADFDFVPSFGAGGGGGPAALSSSSTQAAAPPGAFANFDDAFADFGSSSGGAGAGAQPTGAQPPPPPQQQQQQQQHTNTSSGGNNSESSAFSFEDAFAPPADVSLSNPAAAQGAAPALPSRSTGGGTDTLAAPAPPAQQQRSASPALADDAGPVRQLAAMGFPRHKVIAALEKSHYRVDSALEKLLADV